MQDKRSALQGELDELQTRITELEKALQERADYGLGKGNPAATRREVDRALLERLRRRAKGLKQALSRLQQGLYGICIQCGKPIHPERLAVLPDTTSCVDCAQGAWPKRKRTTVTS